MEKDTIFVRLNPSNLIVINVKSKLFICICNQHQRGDYDIYSAYTFIVATPTVTLPRLATKLTIW